MSFKIGYPAFPARGLSINEQGVASMPLPKATSRTTSPSPVAASYCRCSGTARAYKLASPKSVDVQSLATLEYALFHCSARTFEDSSAVDDSNDVAGFLEVDSAPCLDGAPR
jgi:hypothetical protein